MGLCELRLNTERAARVIHDIQERNENFMSHLSTTVTIVLASVLIVGCGGAPTVSAPKFDSKAIASQAMEMIDKDNDGYLTKDELAMSPGLLDGMRTIDKDGDGKMTADEIIQRMDDLIAAKNASQIVVCQFTRSGNQPVVDAEITFQPEPFMADVIVPATGQTDRRGKAELACPATPLGVQPGFYRVSISKIDGGTETIPVKYNTSTVLGAEVSGLSRGNEIGCYFFTLD
jgi:hypothetical protein